MPEQTFEVKPVGVRYICDQCNEGEMIKDPDVKNAWLTDPVQYPHKCNKCGYTCGLIESYPTVRMVVVNKE